MQSYRNNPNSEECQAAEKIARQARLEAVWKRHEKICPVCDQMHFFAECPFCEDEKESEIMFDNH